MTEVKFESVKEMANFLTKLEQEIIDLENQKNEKVVAYKNIVNQLLGAPSLPELTAAKLVDAIAKLMEVSR